MHRYKRDERRQAHNDDDEDLEVDERRKEFTRKSYDMGSNRRRNKEPRADVNVTFRLSREYIICKDIPNAGDLYYSDGWLLGNEHRRTCTFPHFLVQPSDAQRFMNLTLPRHSTGLEADNRKKVKLMNYINQDERLAPFLREDWVTWEDEPDWDEDLLRNVKRDKPYPPPRKLKVLKSINNDFLEVGYTPDHSFKAKVYQQNNTTGRNQQEEEYASTMTEGIRKSKKDKSIFPSATTMFKPIAPKKILGKMHYEKIGWADNMKESMNIPKDYRYEKKNPFKQHTKTYEDGFMVLFDAKDFKGTAFAAVLLQEQLRLMNTELDAFSANLRYLMAVVKEKIDRYDAHGSDRLQHAANNMETLLKQNNARQTRFHTENQVDILKKETIGAVFRRVAMSRKIYPTLTEFDSYGAAALEPVGRGADIHQNKKYKTKSEKVCNFKGKRGRGTGRGETRRRGRGRGRGGRGRNRRERTTPTTATDKDTVKFKGTRFSGKCHYCNKTGHRKNECKKRIRESTQANDRKKGDKK